MDRLKGTAAAEFEAYLDRMPEPGSKPKRLRSRRAAAKPVAERMTAASDRPWLCQESAAGWWPGR
jgi:hypothetical protein